VRRLLTALVVLGACAAAVVLTAAQSDDSSALKKYEIVFDNAFGLVEGGVLKIGGVEAGKTTDFRLTRGQPYRTIVTAEVTEPGFDSLRADATCDVRQQSLIGEYFVDCDLGESKDVLPDGGRVPVEQTSSTIPPDLINNVMRRPYRERFRLILSELGTGLAGRPKELNDVIRRAHPALRELTETIAILRQQNREMADFFRDADTVSAAVEPYKEEVARWARESADTAEIQASRSEQLGRQWNRLPDFLAELRPTMAELERTATAQIPMLRSLQRAAPDLERFLRATEPFARNTRKALGPLGDMADAGRAAIGESRQEIRQLRRLAAYAPRLGKPLRQFLQAIDDRRRSIENDPAAKAVAPPAPDKTAYRDGQGFTGMEALMNYLHYQTLAINPFDELGHQLRIVLFAGGPCAPYSANPSPQEIRECNSWLGPNQPGITTPDPAPSTQAASSRGAERDAGSRERGRQPRPGEPEARPLPGQRDLSQPQIVLPPEVQKMLDDLRGGAPQNAPRLPDLPAVPGGGSGGSDGSGGNDTGLLDFLLGP
jgi:ABC-type transporter Mla subunit MlaD